MHIVELLVTFGKLMNFDTPLFYFYNFSINRIISKGHNLLRHKWFWQDRNVVMSWSSRSTHIAVWYFTGYFFGWALLHRYDDVFEVLSNNFMDN